MHLLAERNWSWMLFEDEGIFILSVICGSVGIYTLEIQLSANELAEYRAKGEKFLDVIARDISYAQSKYTARQIVNFHSNPAVQIAVDLWRAAARQKP